MGAGSGSSACRASATGPTCCAPSSVPTGSRTRTSPPCDHGGRTAPSWSACSTRSSPPARSPSGARSSTAPACGGRPCRRPRTSSATRRRSPPEIGRAHVCTPVTHHHLVCRLLLEKKKHTSELQSLITISYAVFCLKKKKIKEKTSKIKFIKIEKQIK